MSQYVLVKDLGPNNVASSVTGGKGVVTILTPRIFTAAISSGGVALSNATPQPLGASGSPGVGLLASRDDHTHPRPTLAEIGAAPTAHNHSAADITSDTLAVARGGTGLTTSDLTGQAGKTVRVNPGETGYEVAAAPTSPPPPMTAGAYGVPWSTLASSGHNTQVTLADYWYVGAVFPAYRDLTITTLRMRVTTAGAAGCTTRLAIYQLPSSGQIDGTMTLVSDCGTIPTDTSAPVTLTLSSLSVPLTAGSSYAFAFCSSLGVSFWRSAWQPTTGPSTATFGSEMVYAAFVAAPYGAAPATLTASAAAPSGTETGWRTFVTARWT